MEIAKRHQVGIALLLILALALLLRVWGLGYDLPFIYHPDEPVTISVSQGIFKTGDLNPHFYHYPSLFFYINAFAYIPYYLAGKLLGGLCSRQDVAAPISLMMGVAQAPMPSAVLMGRLITVLFGLGSVLLTFVAGKRLAGKSEVGLLAALFLALSPIHVWHNRWVTPDTFVTFFAVATLVASISVWQRGTTWAYILAGVCAGFTAATKYNGGLVVLVPLAAHFLRRGKQGFKDGRFYLAMACSLLTFIVTNPSIFLDREWLLSGLLYDLTHYSSTHEGQEGDSLRWYVTYLVQTTGVIAPLALWQIVRGVYRRRKEIILVAVFPVFYLAMIVRFAVRNDRTIMPLTPFLFLLAAWLLVEFLTRAWNARPAKAQVSLLAVSGALVATAIILPIPQTLKMNVQFSQVNSREAARVWINANLPQGAKIALEAYAPFVDSQRFSVQAVLRMVDHDPQWYVDNDFDYLVFSEMMFGRFYEEQDRYPDRVQQYDDLFQQFTLVRVFEAQGYEVRVYRIGDG